MVSKNEARRRPSDYERIRAALEYLNRNRRRPVPLAELADTLGLSQFHFQRLFTRWAGISPKRFARYLQLNDARTLLRDARSILDATYDAGLSSPGRLHDLFVSIDAVTPGEFKSGGSGLTIRFGEHTSPFGRCLIGISQRGICWLSFTDSERDGLVELGTTWPAATIRRDSNATGKIAARVFKPSSPSSSPPLRLLVGGTNFQLKVWEALIRIPPAYLTTYTDLGGQIGHPNAARAVGNAVAANPISFLIPCHRVIRRMGVVGEYRWGSQRKQAMIAWEALGGGDTPREPVQETML
ncbi:MAG: methylated-DNA--[protein]-cysteine S-methyltransferase [Phycisphaerae bacterium]|nr:methylated-DNA--[protein]-cysteine S-methyltransferase [Phycisphaerae bacterium]